MLKYLFYGPDHPYLSIIGCLKEFVQGNMTELVLLTLLHLYYIYAQVLSLRIESSQLKEQAQYQEKVHQKETVSTFSS